MGKDSKFWRLFGEPPRGAGYPSLLDGVMVKGVWIHALSAYVDIEDWYSDFTNRVIPEMGDEVMRLYIDCGFHPWEFLRRVKEG